MGRSEAVRLARRLRELRESQQLTQATLADALSKDSPVAVATIRSWESQTIPKLPPEARLRAFALLCSRTSEDAGSAQLPRERDLNASERQRFQTLLRELVELRNSVRRETGAAPVSSDTFDFESGRITVVCPELPAEELPPLAHEDNPNYTRLSRYADLDALMEMWGHLRASNPELQVQHRSSSEVSADDMSGHLVLLGGIGLNQVTSRLMRMLEQLPIRQLAVEDVADGEIFRSRDGREYRPVWEECAETGLGAPRVAALESVQSQGGGDGGNSRALVEDVALLARLRNPFNDSKTLTICNGVYSRGVLGAVRTLTDKNVRKQNEAYIARRFSGGSFAMLLRVPVLNGVTASPDLGTPANRLFEWSPTEEAPR